MAKHLYAQHRLIACGLGAQEILGLCSLLETRMSQEGSQPEQKLAGVNFTKCRAAPRAPAYKLFFLLLAILI